MSHTNGNRLYYGDNLDILERYVRDETIDLIYLDPPFNSNRDYNILFQEQNGTRAAAQIKAFEDTWQWDDVSSRSFDEVVQRSDRISDALEGFQKLLGNNNMLAYLSMMAPRLIELHRVLKPTGSIYLHCDPTASHYIKILMDAIFDVSNFQNEIVWCYAGGGVPKSAFARKHDVILFYSKAGKTERVFNVQRAAYGLMGSGKNWKRADGSDPLSAGKHMEDWWTDIKPVLPLHKAMFGDRAEYLGYQTQKPETLLERIIRASSNEGDIVLDPFCGCGTAIEVAQKLKRKWIGIDITPLAITIIKHRLLKTFNNNVHYKVVGEPVSLPDAKLLAEQDKTHFQYWALGLVGARPSADKEKKGPDKGIDGRLNFRSNPNAPFEHMLLSVKGGHVAVDQVRDLVGTVGREKAAIGVFICLEVPTRDMKQEAASAGFYHCEGLDKNSYAKIQILTIEDLLNGKKIDCPPYVGREGNVTYQ